MMSESIYFHRIHAFLYSLCLFQILKDDKKRAAYDQYGSASQQPGFDPNAFSGFGGAGAGFSGFQDFASAFGGAGRECAAIQGSRIDDKDVRLAALVGVSSALNVVGVEMLFKR